MFKKSIKRICILCAMIMLLSTMCPTNVFAGTYYADSGQHYIDTAIFNNTTRGGYHTYNAKWVQFIATWRPNDVDGKYWSGKDISLEIRLYRIKNGGREFIGSDRLTPSRDGNGKDGNGYYYAGTKWFNLFPNQEYHDGDVFQIEYEAFTAPNQSGTGRNRGAEAYIDVNMGSKW